MKSGNSASKEGPFARALPIVGSHNLRDMGGYQAGDGRQVKWRTLFRSGVMAGLTEADRTEFRQLGIAAIYDLRANHERERRPTQWHQGENIEYYSRDHELSAGGGDREIDGDPIPRLSICVARIAAARELPASLAG